MTLTLQEFHDEFFQDVLNEADAGGRFAEDAFFDLFTEQLIEAGDLSAADRARYVSPRGLRVDGYGGDPVENDGILSLILLDFHQEREVGRLTATELDAIFKRGLAFLTRSVDETFRRSLEETSDGFALAELISATWKGITKVRLFVISNRALSARVDGRAAGHVNDVEVTFNVWDLERLRDFSASGREREDLVINMKEHGGPVAILPAHLAHADYRAYLLVMPAVRLASIYDRWGTRLLEQNVRVFLQARGRVNKGIRNTLENAPEMFFAYNNGITATAESIKLGKTARGLWITEMTNFQIVNGGQTTASVYAASRNKAIDLSRVFVQVKLSVIRPEAAKDVVPKISEFANSQNRVNAADFFSNHPFHLRIKGFSERIFAPSKDGTFRQSKWFYERARGEYQDARSGLSTAEKRKFELEYPKAQVLTKTDLAKVVNCWAEVPHSVSEGSQKNFAKFARTIGDAWDDSSDDFNEDYFRNTVAKVIAFRELERMVSDEPWYEGGYRANVVAYTIAKLAYDLRIRGESVDFQRIWHEQTLSIEVKEALRLGAKCVMEVLTSADRPVVNVTEWAKRPLCWERTKALVIEWPSSLGSALLSKSEELSHKKSAKKEYKALKGIEAQTAVLAAGPTFWARLLEWALAHKILSGKEIEMVRLATRSGVLLSDKQSQIVVGAYANARSAGFPHSHEALHS